MSSSSAASSFPFLAASTRPAAPLRGQFMLQSANPFYASLGGWAHKVFLAELDEIYRYYPQDADRILGDVVDLGWNHVPAGSIWGPTYNGAYGFTNWLGDVDGFARFLRWVQRHAEFSLFLLPDAAPYFRGTGWGWDWALIDRDFTPFYRELAQRVDIRRTILAWEQWAAIPEMAHAFSWQRELFPHAERGWHNGPGHLSPCNGDENEQLGWRSAVAHGVTFFPIQAHAIDDTQTARPPLYQMAYDLHDMVSRFTGAPDSPWGPVPILRPDTGTPPDTDWIEGLAHGQWYSDAYWDAGPLWSSTALAVPGVRYALDGAPTL